MVNLTENEIKLARILRDRKYNKDISMGILVIGLEHNKIDEILEYVIVHSDERDDDILEWVFDLCYPDSRIK